MLSLTLADGFDDQSESGSDPKRFKSEQRLVSAARVRFTSQTVPGSSCDFISDVKHLSHALDIVPGATFTLSGRRVVGSGLKPKRLASYLHPSERGSRTGSTGTFSLAAK